MPYVFIGQELRKYRKQAGLSQTRLAEKLSASLRSVQQWEADRTSIDSDKADGVLAAVKRLASRAARKQGAKR